MRAKFNMHKDKYYKRKSCRICNTENLETVFSLSPTPPGNNLLKKIELNNVEDKFPLELNFCNNCYHLQLAHVVDPKILYQKNYTYVSGTSSQFVNHLKDYSEKMIFDYELKENDSVMDIGSNDGTCLKFFKEKKMRVLGIDPAIDIAKNASQNGIETIPKFFNSKLSTDIKDKYGKFALITSHNACAHIDDLGDVIKGVSECLKDDGIFVMEVGYFYDVFKKNWFDTIYHEHLDYHTVAPLDFLFERFDMKLVDVQKISPQGGSLRVVSAKKNSSFIRSKNIDDLISIEKKEGFFEKKTFFEFSKKIQNVKSELKKILNKIKSSGKSIAGYGAPTKATTLMSNFEIGNNILDFIVDDNPLKQGLYTPITHIPILQPSEIYNKHPDYILILAWNFAQPIIEVHGNFNSGKGKFIIPMPEPKIV